MNLLRARLHHHLAAETAGKWVQLVPQLALVAEHLVVALLAIDQLQLVELHVILLLLNESIFLHNLLVKILDHLEVLGTRRTLLVELLQVRELLFKSAILFLHERRGTRELNLHFLNVPRLLIYHALHLLAQLLLKNALFLAEHSLDLFSSPVVLRQALLALTFSRGDTIMNALDSGLALLDSTLQVANGALKSLDFCLKLSYFLIEFGNLRFMILLEFLAGSLHLADLVGMLLLDRCHLCLMLLLERSRLVLVLRLEVRYLAVVLLFKAVDCVSHPLLQCRVQVGDLIVVSLLHGRDLLRVRLS